MGLLAKLLLVLILLLAGLLVLGPREPVDREISFDDNALGDDIDAYLAQAELAFPNIRDGVRKRVVWAGEAAVKTPLSIVYLHGFSATSEEVRPLPDALAQELGANLYFARLAGHGQDGAAMAGPSAGDWLEDTAEALAIGRRLGDEVIVMATSTGATLAALAALDPELSRDVKAMVLISPNFGIANRASALLTLPFARYWVPLVAGSERSFEPVNERHAQYWTTRYPVAALFPMAALVRTAARQDYSGVTVPALFVLSDADSVVRPDISRRIAAGWGGGAPVHAVTMGPGDDPSAHVIAGDILSPGQTAPLVGAIQDWLRGL